ncbi:hypothetical protein [Vibrio rarus]|uniref:hypothetical protein n=1 Tax=Vibrio rarus TaxID=413403 RepID=UPI0021C31D20|nr:hypothetical protein [Vibrio rarus]
MLEPVDIKQIAQQFCDDLWDCYSERYPSFIGRIDPELFHINVYQHLVSHRSVPDSDGRKLQLALIESFEAWYPDIEQAPEIDWIDVNIDVIDSIQGETGDYGYGFNPSASYVRHYNPQQSWERDINHQLFQTLPTINLLIEDSNLNQEIIRQVEHLLIEFDPSALSRTIPGRQALFDLMLNDVSKLAIASKHRELGVYLYLFHSAVYKSHQSKAECAQLGSSITTVVQEIQMSGSQPCKIDTFWKIGLGYCDTQVHDYNQLISLLDSRQCTIKKENVTDGIELSIWRYPAKDETLQKIFIQGDGYFTLLDEEGIRFDCAKVATDYIMKNLINKS